MQLTVLMIEVEQPEGVSSRKLVLETARHNVLTAYDGAEGLELMRRFPNVDVVILHTRIAGTPLIDVVRGIKQIRSDVPIIVLDPGTENAAKRADFVVPSHEPQALLDLLAKEFGRSKQTKMPQPI